MNHELLISNLMSNPKAVTLDETELTQLAGSSVTYTNELGSTATFTFNTNYTVTGTYTSAVSGGGASVSGPITGRFNGYVISFSVLWPSTPPSITSWVGAYIRNAQGNYDIDTMWLLVSQTQNPGDPSTFWSQVNTGSDLFTPS